MAISQESIIGYLDFYEDFKKFCTNGILRYKDLKSAFDRRNKNALHLCAFNKRFDSLLNHSNRDEILEYARHLPHIFNRPRLHLKQIEEVRPAAIVTRIGPESIRHLASHSEHWKGIKANGLVPERLLARILEDDYAIYENIAAKTLVDKLYAMEKAEYEDIIDVIMNSQLAESFLLGGAPQGFFEAMDFLLKGFEDKESSFVHQLQDEAKEKVQNIIDFLVQCKSTRLYRELKREKVINGHLKNTNIFMMDSYYKKVYHLWSILGRKEEMIGFKEEKDLNREYFVYTELILLFSLRYMGFSCNDDEIVLKDDCFDNLEMTSNNWSVILNSVMENKNCITAEIKKKRTIQVEFQNIDLPDTLIYADYGCKKEGKTLIFEKKISNDGQKELAKKLSDGIEKKNQKRWVDSFRTKLFDAMENFSVKSNRISFIPWKDGIPDNYEEAKRTIESLRIKYYENEFDECYVLNITRPNELKNIKDDSLLRSLVSFNPRNQESPKERFVGILPVSLNDVYSFLRLSKILLKSMILLQDEHKFCPQCGSAMLGNLQTGYKCTNNDCELKIINTQCPDCKRRYWYTDYKFPETSKLATDSPGLKILLEETDFGFRNITKLEVTEDGRHKPICPYCKE